MSEVAFLPGASGKRDFWQPVADWLGFGEQALLFAWPGFGDEAPDPAVLSLTDLVEYCLERFAGTVDLVAQSMGGVVALQLALKHPEIVRRLVLCGTSGGIDLSRFEVADWRPAYVAQFMPTLQQPPTWFVDDRTDVTDRLESLRQPVLLLWGEADRISPPAIGRLLQSLLPNARLITVPGGTHAFASEMPGTVAPEIRRFLAET